MAVELIALKEFGKTVGTDTYRPGERFTESNIYGKYLVDIGLAKYYEESPKASELKPEPVKVEKVEKPAPAPKKAPAKKRAPRKKKANENGGKS